MTTRPTNPSSIPMFAIIGWRGLKQFKCIQSVSRRVAICVTKLSLLINSPISYCSFLYRVTHILRSYYAKNTPPCIKRLETEFTRVNSAKYIPAINLKIVGLLFFSIFLFYFSFTKTLSISLSMSFGQKRKLAYYTRLCLTSSEYVYSA